MRSGLFILVLSSCTFGGEPAPSSVADPAPAVIGQPQSADVEVEGAWARAVPPGTPNSAVFFTAHNRGASKLSITAGSSAVAKSVELHTHAQVDGVMRMRKVDSFEINGHDHHHLKPGGDHVMLIGLSEPLAEGSEIALSLTFADGSTSELTVPVRSSAPASHHHHQGSGHDHGHDHEHGSPKGSDD